ncbi:kekkon 4 [Carabus blaptoides fortunei]
MPRGKVKKKVHNSSVLLANTPRGYSHNSMDYRVNKNVKQLRNSEQLTDPNIVVYYCPDQCATIGEHSKKLKYRLPTLLDDSGKHTAPSDHSDTPNHPVVCRRNTLHHS